MAKELSDFKRKELQAVFLKYLCKQLTKHEFMNVTHDGINITLERTGKKKIGGVQISSTGFIFEDDASIFTVFEWESSLRLFSVQIRYLKDKEEFENLKELIKCLDKTFDRNIFSSIEKLNKEAYTLGANACKRKKKCLPLEDKELLKFIDKNKVIIAEFRGAGIQIAQSWHKGWSSANPDVSINETMLEVKKAA